MEVAGPVPRVMRFGVFELDPVAGELRKAGLRVRLPDQSFKILVTLLEHPGVVVTREELRQELWPDGTQVDFDHSLNAAINRLRTALSDSAENPRFLETAHRGYRFIATVDRPAGALDTQAPSHAAGPILGLRSRKGYQLALASGALAVVLAGLLIAAKMRRSTSQGEYALRIQSLAVMPLENLSQDSEQEYFADGMTEDLIADLAQISELRVISRTSVMQYKRAKKPLPQIARELNVDAVMEGVIERSGDQVRITAQLIYAPADRHLWAKSYERQLHDVLALQDEIARDIAEQVRAKLTPGEKVRLTTTRDVNPAAYETYLKGRFFQRTDTTEGLQKALEYFQKSVTMAPTFALGYAELSYSYMILGNRSTLPSNEAYQKARAAGLKALELDATLPEAHLSLAWIKHLYEWDQLGAESEFKRALELNPSLADAHGSYSLYLVHMLRCDEAIAEARTAEQLDPLATGIHTFLGIAFFCGRHTDQAIEQFRKDLELDPTNDAAQHWLATAYLQKGMFQDAITVINQMLQRLDGRHSLHPNDRYMLGVAWAIAGNREEAIKILNIVKNARRREYVRPVAIAAIYAALGEKDETIRWLQRALEERDDWIVWPRLILGFEGLRYRGFEIIHADPRFQDLMRRVGLPQ
jgi:TolB-like protein/DNA-binding winged helix-turn-helix (wHTH) protein/Tfp pilus assembly protein PilF